MKPATSQILHGDCLKIMRANPSKSVDLVLGSPPYESARTYGIGFSLKGQAWVDWMVERESQVELSGRRVKEAQA